MRSRWSNSPGLWSELRDMSFTRLQNVKDWSWKSSENTKGRLRLGWRLVQWSMTNDLSDGTLVNVRGLSKTVRVRDSLARLSKDWQANKSITSVKLLRILPSLRDKLCKRNKSRFFSGQHFSVGVSFQNRSLPPIESLVKDLGREFCLGSHFSKNSFNPGTCQNTVWGFVEVFDFPRETASVGA